MYKLPRTTRLSAISHRAAQEGAPGFEKVTYFVNRRRQAMLLENGKAVEEITMEAANEIAKELGVEPPPTGPAAAA